MTVDIPSGVRWSIDGDTDVFDIAARVRTAIIAERHRLEASLFASGLRNSFNESQRSGSEHNEVAVLGEVQRLVREAESFKGQMDFSHPLAVYDLFVGVKFFRHPADRHHLYGIVISGKPSVFEAVAATGEDWSCSNCQLFPVDDPERSERAADWAAILAGTSVGRGGVAIEVNSQQADAYCNFLDATGRVLLLEELRESNGLIFDVLRDTAKAIGVTDLSDFGDTPELDERGVLGAFYPEPLAA